MHKFYSIILLLSWSLLSTSQDTETLKWDIGTKWTYEAQEYVSPTSTRFNLATIEIIDTLRQDGKKIYRTTGGFDFMIEGKKVYKTDYRTGQFGLLYDFGIQDSFIVEYIPICDRDHTDTLKQYNIKLDSISSIYTNDGLTKKLFFVTPNTTYLEGGVVLEFSDLSRTIIDDIGFLNGAFMLFHDWELGMELCIELGYAAGKLRCFESHGIQYKFVDYPCDSTWLRTSTIELRNEKVKAFPNPTYSKVQISSDAPISAYILYDLKGNKVQERNGSFTEISIEESGVYLLKILVNKKWHIDKIIRI